MKYNFCLQLNQMNQNLSIEERRHKLHQKLIKLNSLNQQYIRKYLKRCNSMLKFIPQNMYQLKNDHYEPVSSSHNQCTKFSQQANDENYRSIQKQTKQNEESQSIEKQLKQSQKTQFLTIQSEIDTKDSSSTNKTTKQTKLKDKQIYPINVNNRPKLSFHNDKLEQKQQENDQKQSKTNLQTSTISNKKTSINKDRFCGYRRIYNKNKYHSINNLNKRTHERIKSQIKGGIQIIKQKEQININPYQQNSKGINNISVTQLQKSLSGCGSAGVLSYYKKFVEFVKKKNAENLQRQKIVTKQSRTQKLLERYKNKHQNNHKNHIAHLDSYDLQKSNDNKALLNLQNVQFCHNNTKITSNRSFNHNISVLSKKCNLSKLKSSNYQKSYDLKNKHSSDRKQENSKQINNINNQILTTKQRQKNTIRKLGQQKEHIHSDSHLISHIDQYSLLPKINIKKPIQISNCKKIKSIQGCCSSMILKNSGKDKKRNKDNIYKKDQEQIRIEALAIGQFRNQKQYIQYSGLFSQKGHKI